VATVEQDVCSFGIFSILTMQTRQEPSMPMPGVTVVGNRDARLDGGLEDGSTLVDGNRAAVDRQRDGFHKLPIISHDIGPPVIRARGHCQAKARP
jgi:hypothetical protein